MSNIHYQSFSESLARIVYYHILYIQKLHIVIKSWINNFRFNLLKFHLMFQCFTKLDRHIPYWNKKRKLKIWETSIWNLDLDTLGFTRVQFSSLSNGLWRWVNFSPLTKEIRTWFLYRQRRLRNNIYRRESIKWKGNILAFHPDRFSKKITYCNSKWVIKKPTYKSRLITTSTTAYEVQIKLWGTLI